MGPRFRGDDKNREWLTGILVLIAALALAVPALLVHYAPPPPATHRHRAPTLPPRRVVPAAEVPPVEPVELADITPDDARAYNAAQPFADGPNPPARPFRFAGAADDLARATDCLAAAVIYEAGDDAVGEKAVAQVILNRLRHPAFPKTVCGVVFQGSERRTGCQFTFTCDGALDRWHPSAIAWERAKTVSRQALGGAVYRPVGLATHYHTDWVVPYWQSSLDKIAQVETHLFFRWTGWWGTPPAFDRHQQGPEPVIAALAALTGAPNTPDAAVAGAPTAPSPFAPVAGDPDSFLVTLPAGLAPELYPGLAEQACGDRPRCRFSAWPDRASTPAALPLSPQQVAATAFSYLRDRDAGLERTLWNCQRTPRPDRGQCMKVQVYLPSAVTAAPPAPASPAGPPELEGVHRRGVTPPGTAPAPAPSPLPPRPRSGDAATPSAPAAAPQRSGP